MYRLRNRKQFKKFKAVQDRLGQKREIMDVCLFQNMQKSHSLKIQWDEMYSPTPWFISSLLLDDDIFRVHNFGLSLKLGRKFINI